MSNVKKIARARAVIVDPARKAFLAQVNNRVVPGKMTVMLPGGGAEDGENFLQALSREIFEEVGITVTLDETNCRFLMSRTYEFNNDEGGKDEVKLSFFKVDICDAVPRNMEPESILSLSWMTVAELERYLSLDSGWKVQLGALDAIKLALDPVQSKEVEGGKGREIEREAGFKPLRVAALAYGPSDVE